MLRSLAFVVVVAASLIGCVSINAPLPSAPPTAEDPSVSTLPPLASPAPAPTGTPIAPTPAPTPSPLATLPPTMPPTPAPTVPPPTQPAPASSPTASPAGVENYGATTPLINDSFDDPTSGWGVGTNDGGSVAYANSALQIDVKPGHAWEWTRRMTGDTSNAVHVETEYTPNGAGELGLLCASSDDELWGAAADQTGHYVFLKVTGAGATIIGEGQLDSLKKPEFAFARFALDCAGQAAPGGTFKMQLSAPGTNQGVQYFAKVDEGPRNFDRVGIYVESSDVQFSVAVDAVLAFGGTGDTSMSDAAKELITHIPTEWQPDCFEGFASVFLVGVKADVLCQLQGGKSDWAEYDSFDSQADMDASFANMVTRYAVPEQGLNCDTGPHHGGYTIGGEEAGQVLCAPAVTGTQFFWTDNRLLIMSQLIDLEGSYADMYSDWLIAGPN